MTNYVCNNSTASTGTVLKSLICVIALRRYIGDSFLLVLPTESTADHIGQAYNIVDVITQEFILLLNEFKRSIDALMCGI